MQQKTGRPVQFELTADVRASLLMWLERRGGAVTDYAFPSRIDHTNHMSTRQYARLVDEWVTSPRRTDLENTGQLASGTATELFKNHVAQQTGDFWGR